MKISVIIPALNEELNLGRVIKGIKKVKLPRGIKKEIIVVDDGSTDNTSKIAKKENVLLIQHKKNRGKGISLKSGVKKAGGKILVFIDGDGQHNPRYIPDLIRPILDNQADFVIGNRFHKGYKRAPRHRILTNGLTRILLSSLFKRKINDPLSGYRAIKKSVFGKIKLEKKRYEIEIELIHEMVENGYLIKEIPITLIYKNEKSYMRKRDHLRITLYILAVLLKSMIRW